MPTELFTRLELDLVYPPFRALAMELATRCQQKGATFWAISGYRTYAEQAQLYAQGRTAPGKVVTNARPGSSAHQFGLAIDFCRDADARREGLQPDWDFDSYRVLADEAGALGLEPGLSWKTFREGPHVQLHLAKYDVTLAKLDEIHGRYGLKAVWRYLDQLSW